MENREIRIVDASNSTEINNIAENYEIEDMIEMANEVLPNTFDELNISYHKIEVADDDKFVFVIDRMNQKAKKYKFFDFDKFKEQPVPTDFINVSGHYIEDMNTLLKYLSIEGRIEIKIFASLSYIHNSLYAENLTFKETINFEFTFFMGKASFRETTFEGVADFKGVIFGRKANFNETTFEGWADFKATTFKGRGSFVKATFEDKAIFREATFEDIANFENSTFKGCVNFENSTFKFYVNFREATFEDKANFEFSTFKGWEHFWNATFEAETIFMGAIFEGGVYFWNATFRDEVNFHNVTFKDEAIFMGATFESETRFTGARFLNYTNLKIKFCNFLNLSGSINRDIMDLIPDGVSNVDIKKVSFFDMKNIGQIRIKWSWSKNNLRNVIGSSMTDKSYESYRMMENQYRLLKENFHNLGQYEDEDEAYLALKRAERKAIFKGAFKERHHKSLIPHYGYALWTWLINPFKVVVYDWVGGYGTKPGRVFGAMLITLGVFAAIFYLIPNTLSYSESKYNCFWTAIYHSLVTFLTIGYGNVSPEDHWGILISGIEGFMGLFLMSYVTVAFVRKILR